MSLLSQIIAYWKLDEESGTRYDSHAGYDLTDNGTVEFAVGKIDNAADFISANQEYLSHIDCDGLSVAGDQDFSVAFWFYLDAEFSTDALVSRYTGGGTNVDEYLVYYANGVRFIIRASDNTSIIVISSMGFLTPGWYFVVAWRDGINAYVQINNGAVDSQPWTKDTKDADVEFRIGRFGNTYCDDLIDEVGFWKRALTSGERTDLWNGGAGLSYPFGLTTSTSTTSSTSTSTTTTTTTSTSTSTSTTTTSTSTTTTTSTSTSTSTTTTSTSTTTTTTTSTSTSTSTSTTTTLAPEGELVWGEQNPTQGETPVSWQVWSDGAGGTPTIVGDPDWGKLQLSVSEEGRSSIHDFGNPDTRMYTVTRNRYGTGQGDATLQIRGSTTSFNQDDALPNWENYTEPILRNWRYVQVREVNSP